MGGPFKGPDKKWQVLWPRTVAVRAESRGPVQGRVETAGLGVMEGPGERKGDSDPELPARVRGDAVN